MDQIIFEVVKALLVGALAALFKMYSDIIKLKSDMNAAHQKLRELGGKNGTHRNSDS